MLNPKQKKCAELMLCGDKTQKEIAAILKVSQNTISNWKKNNEFVEEYNTMIREQLTVSAASAFNTVVKLLNATNESVRLMAAKDILDRAGFKPTENMALTVEPVEIVDDLKE